MISKSIPTKPLMIFIGMVAVIFGAEVTSMIIVGLSNKQPFAWTDTFTDATILIVIISPLLYSLMIRPLLIQIAARKKAEEDLQLVREQEFRTILRTTMDGFWITDLNGRIVETNDEYCRMTGYSRDEVLRMNITDFEAVESDADVLCHAEKLKGAGFDRFETRHRHKNGKIIDIEISATFHEENNNLFVFLRDISQRKKYEDALNNSKLEMEKLVIQRTEDLNQTNCQLRARTLELEERNRWTNVLRSLGDLLQSCITPEEVYTLYRKSLLELLPDNSGALYMFNNSRNMLISEIAWGPSSGFPESIGPDECWALRRGSPHWVDSRDGLTCGHTQYNDEKKGCYCIPMMAYGEIIGMFSIILNLENDENNCKEGQNLSIEKNRYSW